MLKEYSTEIMKKQTSSLDKSAFTMMKLKNNKKHYLTTFSWLSRDRSLTSLFIFLLNILLLGLSGILFMA